MVYVIPNWQFKSEEKTNLKSIYCMVLPGTQSRIQLQTELGINLIRKLTRADRENMTILKKEKIRQDVLERFNEAQDILNDGVGKFLTLNNIELGDFFTIWQKVVDGNKRFFEIKGVDDRLANLLPADEKILLAKLHRFLMDEMAMEFQKRYPVQGHKIEPANASGVPAEWQIPSNVADQKKAILFIHGGGWMTGSPKTHRHLSVALGTACKLPVLSIDYRLSPESPHPAALNDCVKAYQWLLTQDYQAEDIVIAGDSAGGHLTLTTLLELKNKLIPLPSCAVVLAPATDFCFSSEDYFKKGETDISLADSCIYWWYSSFQGNTDPADPAISPLNGDLKGLPPLLFQVSRSEMLFTDSLRFVEKAQKYGVDATIQSWDEMSHVFHMEIRSQLPEAVEAIEKIFQFVSRHIGPSK